MRKPPPPVPPAPTPNLPARGRGSATLNPQNRFEKFGVHVLGEHLDDEVRAAGELSRAQASCAANHPALTGSPHHASRRPESTSPTPLALPQHNVQTIVLPDNSQTIINRVVDSPDLGFEWTINPYRGCEHGCIYCYARPTHEYLGLSLGLDFETKIMAKRDAPEMLRLELASPKWIPETIVFSGVTDCYQPIEAKLEITRRLLQVCADFRQPVSIITKNRMVTRDIDVLRQLAEHRAARVFISITTLDNELARKMEPRASAPRDRLIAVRTLRDAGIPVGVMTAPIIPGLNDREIPALLEAAAEAGAQHAGWTMMRLPYQLKALFLEWLQRELPERASHIETLIRGVRGGKLSDPRYGTRMRGEGQHAETIRTLFRVHRKRCGLDRPLPALSATSFRRPLREGDQLPLFT